MSNQMNGAVPRAFDDVGARVGIGQRRHEPAQSPNDYGQVARLAFLSAETWRTSPSLAA
jgi:hypothetical protein